MVPSCDSIELPVPELTCNAEEADTRVWLHVKQAGGPRKLVYSPNTDVYHIGLTNIDLNGDEVIIQLRTIGRKLKLLHLNLLCASLNSDPALHSIPDCVKSLQTLYIATGCDFTSFFHGIGKGAFLKCFYRYSAFITGDNNPKLPGSLADTHPESSGFLAFLRLIGVAYYIKNQGAFIENTPVSYYNSFNSPDLKPHEQHTQWYYGIRAKVWERISFEDQLPPSVEALELHWLRVIRVSDYWNQSCHNHIKLLPIEWFGWHILGNTVTVEWDSPDTVQQVRNRVAFLTHGCGCHFRCKTAGRCKCVRQLRKCGPGCSCTNCENRTSNSEGTLCMCIDYRLHAI